MVFTFNKRFHLLARGSLVDSVIGMLVAKKIGRIRPVAAVIDRVVDIIVIFIRTEFAHKTRRIQPLRHHDNDT